MAVPSTAQVRRSSEKVWLPVWKDKDGTAIKNKAGLLPVKPYFHQFAIARYDVAVFLSTPLSDANFKTQLNALNSDTWRGWTVGQAWVSEIWEEPKTIEGTSGSEVRYVIRCTDRVDGWKFQHPNVGYVYKDGGTTITAFAAGGVPYIGNLDNSGDDAATLTILTEDVQRLIAFGSTFTF